MQAAQAGASLAAFPDDCLDVRTVKYDVDSAGHIRHIVTTEIYLHAPSVRRHDMISSCASSIDGILDFLLSYIYTCQESDNGAVSGSALAPGKWQRFLDRARFAQLYVGKQPSAGELKRIYPLVHLRQLTDPSVVSVFIGLPAPDAAVAKAAAIDAGHPLDQEAPRLGHNLPAFTVDLKVFERDLDSYLHPISLTASEGVPTVQRVPRGKLVPSTVPADDSEAALAAVTTAVVAHYKSQQPNGLNFFTEEQLSAVELGVTVGSEVAPLAPSAHGSVFHYKAMNGGIIPLVTVKQLMDAAVTAVVIIIPPALADASQGLGLPAGDTPPHEAASAPAEDAAPSTSIEQEPAAEGTSAADVSLDELEGGSGCGAPVTQPEAAPAPLKICANDLVQVVNMDGSYTGPAKVIGVRAFGVMGDRVVDVQWSLDATRTFGLPYAHVLELLED